MGENNAMTNRIRRVHVFDDVLNPAQAVVRICVYPERLISQTDVRGRLVGPRCPYATTVEVAYALRPVSRQYESQGDPCIITRAIIPDPCLWDPQSPFLYEGPVELWEKGQRCDQVEISHGLRTIKLAPRGWKLNDRTFLVRGIARQQIQVEELPPLHQQGFNTLLVPINTHNLELWAAADQFGFLMLGWISGLESLAGARTLPDHPSFLGCILCAEAMRQDPVRIVASTLSSAAEEPRLGAEFNVPPLNFDSPGFQFVYCENSIIPFLKDRKLARLIRTRQRPVDDQKWNELISAPGVVGWIWECGALN
jgi:hypothetical protein